MGRSWAPPISKIVLPPWAGAICSKNTFLNKIRLQEATWAEVKPKWNPRGGQNGAQKRPPGESQNASSILTPFFHIVHYFSNMAMCCKRSKYHIETTFFICTHGQRKSKKKHSKNISNSLQKPLKNQSQTKSKQRPRKSAPKSASICAKVPKMDQHGSRKSVQALPFFVIFEHWGTSGHPHGPQSFQKRSKEASKRQFGVIFAPIFIHFRPRAFLSSGQQANNLDTHTHPHSPKAPKEVQS